MRALHCSIKMCAHFSKDYTFNNRPYHKGQSCFISLCCQPTLNPSSGNMGSTILQEKIYNRLHKASLHRNVFSIS